MIFWLRESASWLRWVGEEIQAWADMWDGLIDVWEDDHARVR